MSPLEVLQLVGYSTGAALHLWIALLLWRRRQSLGNIERVLMALALAIGAWHASNLILTLHTLLGLEPARWTTLLRVSDTIAVISITLTYSLLLHVHIHLWATARARFLNSNERVRVYLSYIPALFLFSSVPHIWHGAYAPMLQKLAQLSFAFNLNFVQAFLLWACYALALVAITDLLIARDATERNERRLMQTLAASFICIALLIIAVLLFGRSGKSDDYLQTLANLGSLLPTALLAYHIYRYRYLELIIKESLVIASFAVVVLAVYLYGIRTFGEWITTRYGLRAGSIEILLILALALFAAPLRNWLDKYFQRLVARERTFYRDIVARIGAHAGIEEYEHLAELLNFIEERATQTLQLRRMRIITLRIGDDKTRASDNVDGKFSVKKYAEVVRQICERELAHKKVVIEDEHSLVEIGFRLAYTLRRDERVLGLMLVDAPEEALTKDTRGTLEVLAGQIAIAVEDAWLSEENVRLEEQLAHGERLASLGRMAATVAHEVKNPLSAIKSIAQVMLEDEKLKDVYARDLDLIVGETNRLSRSVTQLLSFARTTPIDDAPCSVVDLMLSIITLFRVEAGKRNIEIEWFSDCGQLELDGARAAALRDAFSNLLLNALHATAPNKSILVEAQASGDALAIAVTDGGAGVDAELSERIWEPFFTTKQRGTGLGLAIVRKRIQDVGGSAQLIAGRVENGGARFEIRLPLMPFS